MGDMKGEIQEIADDIAWREHDCEFYDLSEKLQLEVYGRAVAIWNDKMADKADRMLDSLRAEGIDVEQFLKGVKK